MSSNKPKIFVDYVPLGPLLDSGEWKRTDIENLKRLGNEVLIMLLGLKGEVEISKDELNSLGVHKIKELEEASIISVHGNTCYLNMDYPLFQYLLCEESQFEDNLEKVAKKVAKRQISTNAKLEPDVQLIFDKIQEERKGIGLNTALKPTEANIGVIRGKLLKHKVDDILPCISSFFEWIKEEYPERRNAGRQIKTILGNLDNKIKLTRMKNPEWRKGREAPPVKNQDSISAFYGKLLPLWDEIAEGKIKVRIDGTLNQRKYTALAWRIFKQKLKGETPGTAEKPEDIWRFSWKSAISRGGLGSNADDDLSINGHLHSVKTVSLKAPNE